MEFRQYQADCEEAIFKAFEEYRKVLIVVPTGGGKTHIFSRIAHRLQKEGKRTLILAHRDELIDQAIDKLYRATGVIAQKEKAEWHASLTATVVVASVQTMLRRLDKWPPDHFELVVADEAHHALSDSWQRTFAHFASAFVLGVTATPHRGDMRNLGEYFENVAYEIKLITPPNEQPEGLVNQGYLCPIVIQSVPLKINLKGADGGDARTAQGDFDTRDIAFSIEPYLDEIANEIANRASFRRILAFLPLRATSHKFVEACRKAGLNARHIDGDSEDRKDLLKGFARWDFDVLSNAMLLTEGYDDPGISCVVVLRPTQSQPLFAQMVGRGTRIDTGKENLLLLDFLWMHEKHDIVRPAHLVARDDLEADLMTKASQNGVVPAEVADELKEHDLRQLSNDVAHQREEALRKELEKQRQKEARVISPGEFALAHEALHIAEYVPVAIGDREPPTEDQMKWIKKARIHPQTGQIFIRDIPKALEPHLKMLDHKAVKTKGHAARLLDILFNKKWEPVILASPRQRYAMKMRGHPNWENATVQEARAFFAKSFHTKHATMEQ